MQKIHFAIVQNDAQIARYDHRGDKWFRKNKK